MSPSSGARRATRRSGLAGVHPPSARGTLPSVEALIQTRGLAKVYRRRAVLDGIDWSVARGGVHALLGVPGAGKTVLSRLLLGFIPPSAGEARILGAASWRMPRILRGRLGYLPEQSVLPRAARVAEMLRALAFEPRFDKGLEHELRERLEVRLDVRGAELSAHERRRLELRAALALRPELVWMDGPERGLSAEESSAFGAAVAALARGSNTTFVWTSSDAARIEPFVERVSILHAGRLLETADKAELLRDVREIELALELYPRAAAAASRAGIVSARTDRLRKVVVVRRSSADLEAELRAVTGGTASIRALDLAGIFRATVDVASTGTGSAP